MSSQLIELIIFAGIALYIINRLVSTLGTTSDDKPNSKPSSFFGQKAPLKDVTSSTKSDSVDVTHYNSLETIMVKENKTAIQKGLKEVIGKLPSFNPNKFLQGAQDAVKMILESVHTDNGEQLESLVDKRYIRQFKDLAESYGKYNDTSQPELKISEIYMFGNNIFVKISCIGDNVTQKIKHFQEEWTFTKSILSGEAQWYLTNIDKPH
ncbi:MAG: Tim44/TimA family putative adaptor protein [Rickettsiaceae bacterium]